MTIRFWKISIPFALLSGGVMALYAAVRLAVDKNFEWAQRIPSELWIWIGSALAIIIGVWLNRHFGLRISTSSHSANKKSAADQKSMSEQRPESASDHEPEATPEQVKKMERSNMFVLIFVVGLLMLAMFIMQRWVERSLWSHSRVGSLIEIVDPRPGDSFEIATPPAMSTAEAGFSGYARTKWHGNSKQTTTSRRRSLDVVVYAAAPCPVEEADVPQRYWLVERFEKSFYNSSSLDADDEFRKLLASARQEFTSTSSPQADYFRVAPSNLEYDDMMKAVAKSPAQSAPDPILLIVEHGSPKSNHPNAVLWMALAVWSVAVILSSFLIPSRFGRTN